MFALCASIFNFINNFINIKSEIKFDFIIINKEENVELIEHNLN